MRFLTVQGSSAAKGIFVACIFLLVALQLAVWSVEANTRAIGLILLVVCLIISVAHQRLLLYAFLAAYVFLYDYLSYTEYRLFTLGGANIYLGDAFIFLFLSSSFIVVLQSKAVPGLDSKVGVAIVLFITWALIGVIRGIPTWGYSAVGESRFIIWGILFFPVVQSIRKQEHFETVLRLSLVLILAYTVFRFNFHLIVECGGDLQLLLHTKFMGASRGVVLVSVFAFCLVLLLTHAVKNHRVPLIILAVVCGILIPLGARTALVAWLVSSLFILMTIKRWSLGSLFPLILIMGVAALFIISFDLFSDESSWDPQASRGLTAFTSAEARETGTAHWRLMGWENIITGTLGKDPLFGEGFGGYYDIFEAENKGVPPHNDWLLIFSKTGFVGLIFLFNVIYQVYATGFRYIKRSTDILRRSYMQALLAAFLIGLVAGTFFMFFQVMWVAAGLQVALINLEENRSVSHSATHMRVSVHK